MVHLRVLFLGERHQLVCETCMCRMLFDTKSCSAIEDNCKDVSLAASWQVWVTLLTQQATTSSVYDITSMTLSFAATEEHSVLCNQTSSFAHTMTTSVR